MYSWQIADEPVSLVTVEFRANGAETEVVVTHDRLASRAHRDDHERGWHGCLDGLARWA